MLYQPNDPVADITAQSGKRRRFFSSSPVHDHRVRQIPRSKVSPQPARVGGRVTIKIVRVAA